jgi:hypothetical protein
MSGGLFAYFDLGSAVAPRSLSLLPRRPALIALHDTNVTDKVQHRIQVKERRTLPTLHVFNVASPAGPSGRPVLPKADDEGADWWNWG